jgi:hypothetical protein
MVHGCVPKQIMRWSTNNFPNIVAVLKDARGFLLAKPARLLRNRLYSYYIPVDLYNNESSQ